MRLATAQTPGEADGDAMEGIFTQHRHAVMKKMFAIMLVIVVMVYQFVIKSIVEINSKINHS